MRAINHALTGAAIGFVVGEPVIAAPLAFLSHYVCDVIPHYGPGAHLSENEILNKGIFRLLLLADICLCGLLVLILALSRPQHWVLAAVCAFLAASPDLFSFNRYRRARSGKQQKPNSYLAFAHNIQWFERPIGVVVEVVWAIAMLIVIVPIIAK